MLQDAERLLHAERFAEAQALFEKVGKSKHDRRAALLGLAEIAFQEKNYAEAVNRPSGPSIAVGASRRTCCWATRISGSGNTKKRPRRTPTR